MAAESDLASPAPAGGAHGPTGIYELELATEDFGARALWDEYATGRCRVRIER